MKKVIALLLIASVCSVANATWTITQTEHISAETLDINRTVRKGTALEFDKFDDQMYNGRELVSVSLQLKFTVLTGSWLLDNDADEAISADISYSYEAETGFSGVTVSILNEPYIYYSRDLTVDLAAEEIENGDGTGFVSPAGDDSQYISGITTEQSNTTLIDSSDASSLASFIGTDTFNIELSISRLLDISGYSGLEFSGFSSTADADMIVTYEYTPEPATMALLGLGGLFIKRRRA